MNTAIEPNEAELFVPEVRGDNLIRNKFYNRSLLVLDNSVVRKPESKAGGTGSNLGPGTVQQGINI